MQDESQAPKRFLSFFSQDVANLILERLPINDVKTVSRVSRGDYACTAHFIATSMIRIWEHDKRVKNTAPPALRYHYSCAQYYAACSDARKSKALMRFFSMLMSDLMANYGKRLNQCVMFNREELPEQLRLTCEKKHLLPDISDFLLEKFNFSLEFIDKNDTTHAVITREQVERHCATMLFQTIVYDFLSTQDRIKIIDHFLKTTLFSKELKIVDKHQWPLFEPRVVERNDSVVTLETTQSSDTLIELLHSKLHYLADDRPNPYPPQHDSMIHIEMRHLENQPGFFSVALQIIQPLIKRIMQENIPPDTVEIALETEFAAYEKPAPEAKNDKCCVM